ncbi:hypothetical protein BU14_3058s0001, partial [Porphyra umbilicalis]
MELTWGLLLTAATRITASARMDLTWHLCCIVESGWANRIESSCIDTTALPVTVAHHRQLCWGTLPLPVRRWVRWRRARAAASRRAAPPPPHCRARVRVWAHACRPFRAYVGFPFSPVSACADPLLFSLSFFCRFFFFFFGSLTRPTARGVAPGAQEGGWATHGGDRVSGGR